MAVVEEDTADCEQSLAAVKEEQLSQLQSRVLQLKQSLTELVEKKKALSQVGTQALQVRSRVRLLRQAHTESKRAHCKELEELERLKRSNYRREERLKKVRSKDLHRKEEKVEEEFAESRAVARQRAEELVSLRKAFLSHAHSLLFPMEVEPLSYQDAGEEDYTESSQIDCDTSLEVAGGWLLSGQHKLPTPHIRVLSASLPSNGDYSLYVEAAKERRKAYKVTARMEVAPPPSSHPPPTSDPYLTIPAALVYTAQFVDLIATTIDQPLPYPLPLDTAISEYGNPDRRKRDFLDSVAKLDDNITYLCFSQHVPLSALTPGHTLENLLALVTHTQLGRGGAFECHPDLTRYSGTPPLSHDSDNEPPSISYTADQSLYSSHGDTSESEDESSAPSTLTDIDGEWESVEHLTPNERLDLEVGSLGSEMASNSTELENSHMYRAKERMRHLDYNSTYQDYAALSSSEKSATTSALSTVDSVTVMGTVREGEKGEENEGSEGGGGWLGTLSSLWTSTLRRTS